MAGVDVSVTLPPLQKVVGPLAVMAGTGGAASVVTLTGADVAPQPLPSKACTLYEPAILTVMDCVVAPLDQSQELAALAVSVTLPLGQRAVGPLVVMTGAAGGAYTVTLAGAEVALQPEPSVA